MTLSSESILSTQSSPTQPHLPPVEPTSTDMGLSLKTELTTLADRSQTQPLADEPLQISIPPLRKELEIFASTFFTIFLAELGDKTQLTTLLMSAESRNPWIVFAGAGSALIATSLLGVLIGRWLATRVSPKTLETAAGMLLLLIAVMLLWDVVKI